MKKLLIVESPAKIKTLSKFLGTDFKIMSTMGHIVDLPTKKLGVIIKDNAIAIDYVPIEGKEKTIADICKAASTADEIYLAPDPDREGEIIAWHVEQEIKRVIKKNARIYRISFNEITKDAVIEAIENPHDVDLKKVAAQQARRILDRWVGYEVSPILWVKIAKGLSAGRVQSVALRLICDREEAIRNFKPEEYWTITGVFGHNKDEIAAQLTHIGKKKAEVASQKEVEELVPDLKKAQYVIDSITDKERLKNPLPPFMTSTLQQAAFNQLGFSVKKTMQLAQQLYEGVPLSDPKSPVALITYMRTDSLRLSDTALKQGRAYVAQNFSKEYLPSKANVYAKEAKSKTAAQDAHEAIRPINVDITPQNAARYLPADLAKLYELIWKRFVACQMKPALYAQRQVVIKGDEKYFFKVTGSTLLFDGYLKVYNAADDEEKEEKALIPDGIKKDDDLKLKKIDPKQHFTQPPPKYTEASLVKEFVKEGIGRPSTYNAILNTIQARQYTTTDSKKRFTPTELGMAVTKLLVENLPKIMDTQFTANMEQYLDDVAKGDLDRNKLLFGFYDQFSEDVTKFRGKEGKRTPEVTNIICPKCHEKPLSIRFGKTGNFLGCTGYPECSFTSNFIRKEDGTIELKATEAPKVLEEKCPTCGQPLREVMGKYGPFIACSGYPECKYIHQIKANFKCPQDGSDIVQRRWRGGSFWGCSNYPKCKFAIFGDIEQIKCPKCKKQPYLLKKTAKDGSVTLTCPDKECGYTSTK